MQERFVVFPTIFDSARAIRFLVIYLVSTIENCCQGWTLGSCRKITEIELRLKDCKLTVDMILLMLVSPKWTSDESPFKTKEIFRFSAD